jgi:hypothetical protein
MLVGNGLIITKRTHSRIEEFSPFSCRDHMGDDLTHDGLIFLFGILLIEDTVRFVSQPNASKDIFTVET